MIVRRVIALALFTHCLGGQAFFLLDLLGWAPGPPVAVWLLPLGLPVVAVALFWGRESFAVDLDEGRWWPWALAGLGVFAGWSASYYAVAALVDPARTLELPEWVLSRLPVVPSWALVYITVQPFTVLPYLVLGRHRVLERLLAADVLILLVSVVVWTALPVGVPRGEAPVAAVELGPWVLSIIRSADPSVNCLPSTHCAMALAAALALRTRERWLGRWALATALAIGLSTMLLRQHYAVDVVTGYGLAAAAWWAAPRLIRLAGRAR